MIAVIQAGGQGARLKPYTLVLPKPLMPVGGLPVIEMLLKWLRRNGIHKAYITTGYLGHLIRSLCGNGEQWDIELAYSVEPEPLGTVGALQLLSEYLDETFLVLNGDLITDLNLRAFYEFHKRNSGLLSIAVTDKNVRVDLGVLETEGDQVADFKEKPSYRFQVSMGVYLMEPEILKFIPKGVPFGFDDLMLNMLDQSVPVYVYRHQGAWMDIGRPEDFQRAQELFPECANPMLGI